MNPVFDIHIFVCTNERSSIDKKSCGDQHGLNLIAEFKTQLNAYKLPLKIRTQKSGCLGICQFGPTIAIYPEGIFYVGLQLQDVKEIVESHIINKTIVERLVLNHGN
jgi:(2Fe-2S) ferredoxin